MNGLEEAEELEALLTRALKADEPPWTVVLDLIMFICSTAAAAVSSSFDFDRSRIYQYKITPLAI